MILFANADFCYRPFPIGLVKPAFEPGVYEALLDAFPPVELFKNISEIGVKYSLSEKYNSRQFHDFVAKTPVWRDFRRWVKSPDFIGSVDAMLRDQDIDLGMRRQWPDGKRRLRRTVKDISRGHWPQLGRQLGARFEFSALPADGGSVMPHTDNPSKIITLVVSMVRDGEWDPAFGGGTDVLAPKDPRREFNLLNKQLPFDDVEVINTFPFTPNQCVVFVKTFNSLHAVRPMLGKGSEAMRRTLTINIEHDE